MSNNRRDVTFWTEVAGELRQVGGSSIEVSVNTEEDEVMEKIDLDNVKWIKAVNHKEDEDSGVSNGEVYEVYARVADGALGEHVVILANGHYLNIYGWELEIGNWEDVTEEVESMENLSLNGIKRIKAISHNEDRDSNVVNGREYEVIGSPKENDMGGYVTVFDGEEYVNVYEWEIEDGDWKDVTEHYEDGFKTMRYEIGDYVKVVSNQVSHGYNVGGVYKIEKIVDDSYWLEGHENVLGPFISGHDLQYVPQEAEAESGEEDVEEAETLPKAIVTNTSWAMQGFNVGDEVEVCPDDTGGYEYQLSRHGNVGYGNHGEHFRWVTEGYNLDELVRAANAVGDEYERKYAMDAKVGAFMRHADGLGLMLDYNDIVEVIRIVNVIQEEDE